MVAFSKSGGLAASAAAAPETSADGVGAGAAIGGEVIRGGRKPA
jgi:hypothetical protein